jgi:hypothetical protein
MSKIWRCKDRITNEVKYFGAAAKMRKFRLERGESVISEELLEYDYKYQLVILLQDAYDTGYEDGKATNS